MQEVILIGGFPETYELCEEVGVDVRGIIDFDAKVVAGTPYAYLGEDRAWLESNKDLIGAQNDLRFFVTPDKPALRKKIVALYESYGCRFATLVSPTATVSKNVEMAEGVVVQTLAAVMSCSKIGKCSRINVRATVMHHATIGECVTVAPGAVVLGYVTIGDGAYVGANATVLPYVKIGKGAVIGAGAVVTKDVPDGETWIGVPARKMA